MSMLTCRFCGKIQYRPETSNGDGMRCSSCLGLLSMDGVPLNPPPEPPDVADRPEDPPAEEQVPFGKYTLRREIGRGSMGIVYDANETTLNRRVALKIMFSRKSDDPKEAISAWQRFIQEARLSANVTRHPNLVTVYEAGVHEGRRFIAMEHIQGKPIPVWREESGASRREQVRLLRDVALAVHHAHENGIIHRDLKPSNVLVDHRNIPFVTDFGVAKSLSAAPKHQDTPSGTIVGSPAYMSPEQALGKAEVDRRTDVYSLGVMLYEILAGRVPFEGKTPIDVLRKVAEDPVEPPSKTGGSDRPNEPDETLDVICLRAMARKTGDRFETGHDLAVALSEWLGDTLPVPAETRKPVRKTRVLIAGLLAVLAGVALSAFWNARLTNREADGYALLGNSLLNSGEHQEALLAFERALTLDAEHPEALEGKAEVSRTVEKYLAVAQAKAEEDARRLRDAEAARKAAEEQLRLLKTAAVTVPLLSFEPRKMSNYKSSKDRIRFLSKGLTVAPVAIAESGTYEIQVVASCREAAGEYARFLVQIDGRTEPEVELTDTLPRLYRVPCSLEAGTRMVGIRFTNDLFDAEKKLDRNLYIHSVVIRRTR